MVWSVFQWSVEILNKAHKDGLITNAPGYSHMMGRLADFRHCLCEVAAYGHIPVPLVYTQVVHLAVYVYFAVSIIGEQWLIWRKVGLTALTQLTVVMTGILSSKETRRLTSTIPSS